jgi:hypothetical protein
MSDSATPILLTQEELERAGAYWQKALRLQDWDVKHVIARARDMGTAVADCDYMESLKRATIRVMDPIDNNTIPERWPRDMEADLLHEILHLHFAPYYPRESAANDPTRIAMEQAIDLISLALLNEHRKQHEALTS